MDSQVRDCVMFCYHGNITNTLGKLFVTNLRVIWMSGEFPRANLCELVMYI